MQNTGSCPACRAINSYSAATCIDCGAALPWADALQASVAAKAQATKAQQAAPVVQWAPAPIAPARLQRLKLGSAVAAAAGLCVLANVMFGPGGSASHAPAQRELWDAGGIVGLDIDQVRAKLGPPSIDQIGPVQGDRDDVDALTWEAEAQKKMLNVYFHRGTRQVTKIEVDFEGADIQNMPADYHEFLTASHLSETDPRYRVEPRESENPNTGAPRGVYAGVDIVAS